MVNYKLFHAPERHKLYYDAFDIKASDSLTEVIYLSYISKYIMDPNISASNIDDLMFFNDLLFQGKFGAVDILYCDWVMNKWQNIAFPQSIMYLSKFIEFYIESKGYISYDKDIFKIILLHKNKNFAIHIYDKLNEKNKIQFIEVVKNFPDILQQIPKLKQLASFL